MVQKKASFSNKDESVNISFIQHKSVRIGLNNIYYSSKYLIEKNKQNPKPFPNQWTPKKEKKKNAVLLFLPMYVFQFLDKT